MYKLLMSIPIRSRTYTWITKLTLKSIFLIASWKVNITFLYLYEFFLTYWAFILVLTMFSFPMSNPMTAIIRSVIAKYTFEWIFLGVFDLILYFRDIFYFINIEILIFRAFFICGNFLLNIVLILFVIYKLFI